MKKVRIIAAFMAVVMAVAVLAGCNRNKTPWQEEAKTLVAEKMDDSNVGQFVLDGVKYSFPMQVKELTDNGWKFSSLMHGIPATLISRKLTRVLRLLFITIQMHSLQ